MVDYEHLGERPREVFSRRRVVGNFFWNIVGKGWSALLALIYIPILVHGLGDEAYGIYAILAVLLSYFQFLELGFGRALEKYSAEALGAGEPEKIQEYFSTAFWLQMMVGVLSAGLLWLAGPSLVPLLKMSSDSQPKAMEAIRLAGLSFGFSIAASTPAGVIRAYQRFDVLNGIDMATQTLLAALSIGAVYLRLGLRGQMWAVVIKSFVTFTLLLIWSLRLSGNSFQWAFNKAALKKLFRFGGYLTLSGLMAPILVNIEKVMMGAFISVGVVTYYMVPYSVLGRIKLLPGSLSSALFPYMSTLEGQQAKESIHRINWRATELLAWALLPLFCLVWISGEELLAWWMGHEFALRAGTVMKILATGFFINMLAYNSLAVIQARGRPQLLVAFYIVETVLYVPLAYLLMTRWGIVGAAGAWLTRVAVDTALMWTFATSLSGSPKAKLPPVRWKALTVASLVLGAGVYVSGAWISGPGSVLLALLVASFLLALGWFRVLDASERALLPKLITPKPVRT